LKESIADVASIFADFYADLKVPASDLAAGFVLLSKYQSAQRRWIVENSKTLEQGSPLKIDQFLSGIPIREDTKFLDLSTADDSHLVNDLIYYLNYSLAIFGWPMHLVDDPCLLCCIYPYLRLSPCCSSSRKTSRNPKQKSTSTDCARLGGNSTKKFDKRSQNTKSSCPKEISIDALDDEESRRLNTDDRGVPLELGNQIGKLDENCDTPIILEDNCCSCNVASAERRLASHNYEIIYVSYKVNVNVVPFLVAVDHSKQSIVVAIRGSMSLSDMVTDMNGQVDRVPIKDCPEDWFCHRGITRAAMYVKLTLEQEFIIERAMSCRPDLNSENYSIVLCGHSLGAGAAAILGVLMRPKYPTLRAYLYSPPGGVLSMPVVEYTREFAIGVILGNDTVPRLGVAQLERLRYQTLLSIKSAQKSSGKILAKALCPSSCFGKNKVEYDPLQSLDLLHGTEGRPFDYNGTRIPFQSQSQVLYVPGRLIHVVKNYTFNTTNKSSRTTRLWTGPIYQAVWTDNSIYDRIIISEGMFYDHLPNKVMQAMKMLFSKTLPARSESKSPSANVVSVPIMTTPTGTDQVDGQEQIGREEFDSREGEKLSPQVNIEILSDHEDKIGPNKFDDGDDNNNNNNQTDREASPGLVRVDKEQFKITKCESFECNNNLELRPIIGNKAISYDENGNEENT